MEQSTSATPSLEGAPGPDPRALWLEDRRSAIGGSEVAAILLPIELRPEWCQPINVWLDKRGELPDEEKPWMTAGKRMERTILEMYADRQGVPIEFADSYNFIRDPQLSILGASLDARLLGGDRRPVDAKNLRFKDSAKFGAVGSDVIPLYYALQLHVQMAVTGAPCADLAVLFSGQDLEPFTVFRDEETLAVIRERVEAWWKKHIIGGVPPEPDGSTAFSDYLSRRFKGSIEKMVQPDDDIMAAARDLAAAREAYDLAGAEKERLENVLKLAIGDFQGIQGVCTWKRSKDSEGVHWDKVAADLAERLYPLEGGPFKDAAGLLEAAAKARHGVTKAGSRRFLFNLKEI